MNIAEMICAYEAGEHPFADSDDTPAQEFLRKTFPVPVIVMTGMIATGNALDFIEAIEDAATTEDAANVLGRYLASNQYAQLRDFFETMAMIDEAWSNCAIDESGKVWIEGSIDPGAN